MPRQSGLGFKFYRVMLRLYPKPFRDTYSDQMAQTLIDMLDDQPDTSERSIVWLRVIVELPFSIAQENIITLRGNTMDKLSFVSNKKLALLASIAAAVIMVILAIIFRVWIHRTLLPNTAGMFYRHGLRRTLSAQNTAINNPFETVMGPKPDSIYSCDVIADKGIKTRIDCQASLHSYASLGQDQTSKAKVLEAVKNVEFALKSQGYQAGSNNVTLTSLVTGTYQGKDYSPDAFYQKIVGSSHCIFDIQIAYSNPKPPTITMMLSCNRTFTLFGDPGYGIYYQYGIPSKP